MYCKYCGKEWHSSVCDECKKEKQKAYNKKSYEKTKVKRFKPERWEFRIGIRKDKIKQLEREIQEITKRIKDGK